jgi:hypothetical protein
MLISPEEIISTMGAARSYQNFKKSQGLYKKKLPKIFFKSHDLYKKSHGRYKKSRSCS